MFNIPNSPRVATLLDIPTPPRVATLIDGDNALNHLEQILKISDYYGTRVISRAYGDWKQLPLSASYEKVRDLNIETIQVDCSAWKKDSTDKQLLIEGGEILGAGDANIFIIVSGDGDFRQLAERIKSKGLNVIGICNKGHTSDDLQKECDAFYFIEDLEEILIELERATLLQKAYTQVQRNGQAHIAHIGLALRKLDAEFESRFRKKKLSEWLDEYSHIFQRHDNHISLR